MGLQVLIEDPIRWLQGASRSRTVLPLGALRPLTVVTALALLLNLISGLFAQELWPTTIAAHLAKL